MVDVWSDQCLGRLGEPMGGDVQTPRVNLEVRAPNLPGITILSASQLLHNNILTRDGCRSGRMSRDNTSLKSTTITPTENPYVVHTDVSQPRGSVLYAGRACVLRPVHGAPLFKKIAISSSMVCAPDY